jgi:hypothetical protein
MRDFFVFKKVDEEDKRPFWLRLLKSIKIVFKPSISLRRPIQQVIIRGKVDF